MIRNTKTHLQTLVSALYVKNSHNKEYPFDKGYLKLTHSVVSSWTSLVGPGTSFGSTPVKIIIRILGPQTRILLKVTTTWVALTDGRCLVAIVSTIVGKITHLGYKVALKISSCFYSTYRSEGSEVTWKNKRRESPISPSYYLSRVNTGENIKPKIVSCSERHKLSLKSELLPKVQ